MPAKMQNIYLNGIGKLNLKTITFDVGAEYENERDKNGNYKRVLLATGSPMA